MPYRAASLDTPRQPSFRSAIGPPPRQVVCFVNRHRLITVSSPSHHHLVARLVARRRRTRTHSHTRTLAHSHTAPSRQAHTHSHLVPLKVTGEQPALNPTLDLHPHVNHTRQVLHEGPSPSHEILVTDQPRLSEQLLLPVLPPPTHRCCFLVTGYQVVRSSLLLQRGRTSGLEAVAGALAWKL